MTGRVLACGFCSGGDMHQGANMLWGFLLVLGVAAGLILLGRRETRRKRAGLPPREPVDSSPFVAGLLSGQHQDAYRATVKAVTPAGVRVNGPCCRRGHRSPGLAAKHAAALEQRIATEGR